MSEQILILFLVIILIIIIGAGWLIHRNQELLNNKDDPLTKKKIGRLDLITRWAVSIGSIANLIYTIYKA